MKLNKNLLIITTILSLNITFNACKKDNTSPEVSGTGKMEVEFDNRVGTSPLELNSTTYQNAQGDDFTVSTFKYYISNITLVKSDGSSYLVPESYYLIDAADENTSLRSIEGIPAGDYNAIKLTIGVDSLRNSSGAQTGDLDPAKGMFWTWNTGYVFVKFEGTSSKSTAAGNKLAFHIGGSQAPNNTIRTVTQNFQTPLKIRNNGQPELHFMVDAASLFKGSTTVDFSQLNLTMGGPSSVIVADNYANGFIRLDHVHN